VLEPDRIYALEARDGLRKLADASVDCVLTSPPYWATRRYGGDATAWADGWSGSLGLEPSYDQYLAHLLEVFDEVARVLKPTGTLWVNLADTYAGSWRIGPPRGGHGGTEAPTRGLALGWNHRANPRYSAKISGGMTVQPKSLCLIPERFVIAMTTRGWVLRNRIVWHKPNHMPASVKDRFACSWEYVFLFVRSKRYWFDLDAVRVPPRPATLIRNRHARTVRDNRPTWLIGDRLPTGRGMHPKGCNPGDYWSLATGSTHNGHPAVYPERLCRIPILAGCPKGGLVLDPFMGSGTTAVVAKQLGRHYLGFEVNPRYVKLARQRVARAQIIDDKGGAAKR
jgi:DNA modification methylase